MQRLYPYFNGKYSVEEILFTERLSRKEFSVVLESFKKDISSFKMIQVVSK